MKKVVYALLKPIAYFTREIIQKNKVTIVLFHKPSIKSTQIAYAFYNKYYNIIELNQYLLAKENGTLDNLPKKSIVITFDDGWRDNYLLLETFKKYKIKPTIFITTGLIDNHKDFLTSKNLLEMEKFVHFESHTVLHPNMLKTESEILKKELTNSKNYLEKLLNKEIHSFAYPFGKYNKESIKLVQLANYKYALTVDLGFNSYENNFLLKRICISDNPSLNELYVKSTGIWELIKKVLKRKRDENPSLL